MARVAIRRCPSYENEDVTHAVRALFDDLGVAGDVVPDGCGRIFLKVNLLRESAPDDGIITHPAIVEAVVNELKATGAEIMIGDSPSGKFTTEKLERTYQEAGLTGVAERTGAVLNYDTSTVEVDFPSGRVLRQFRAVKAICEADVLISMPKMKTHLLTTFTGATKNLYGALPGLVKARYHGQFPSVMKFSEMLLDVLEYFSPDLAIMDGVVGMEGLGPAKGKLRKVGLVLGSRDSVALDAVACDILGIPSDRMPVLAAARKRGLGETDPGEMEIVGDGLDDVRVEPFLLPTTTSRLRMLLPSRFDNWAARLFAKTPQVDPARCRACNACVESCPKHCIRLVADKAVIDESRCQRCYCCHEVCPHGAIALV